MSHKWEGYLRFFVFFRFEHLKPPTAPVLPPPPIPEGYRLVQLLKNWKRVRILVSSSTLSLSRDLDNSLLRTIHLCHLDRDRSKDVTFFCCPDKTTFGRLIKYWYQLLQNLISITLRMKFLMLPYLSRIRI